MGAREDPTPAGITPSEGARQVTPETEERKRAGLAGEATALARNPAYAREAREVAALMEQLRGSP